MQFSFSDNSCRKYFFPVLLFIISYSFLSYNLEYQGINIDEWFHYGFAMAYFDLTKEGKLMDPCFNGKGDCQIIDLICAGQNGQTVQWVSGGGFVKHIFVGLGDYFFSDNERTYYTSVDKPCRPLHHDLAIPGVTIPTQTELAAARFFSPIFGSLSIVLLYYIGKLLFNKFIGISFSIFLLFHGLWMHHSRIIISEVYSNFFIILSVFLLLYAFSSNKTKIIFLICSASSFALAFDTRITSLVIIPLLILIIFFRGSWSERINLNHVKQKNFILKSSVLVLIFVSVFVPVFIIGYPFYYPDPIGQLSLQYDTASNYAGLNMPSNHPKKILIPITASATIAPLIDAYYYLFSPENIPQSVTYGHTFTSIPLTFFFLMGLYYLLSNIKKKKFTHSEFLILCWYVSIYILISLFIESYNTSRHFIPLIFPMALIASYGLWCFLENFLHPKIKIFFLAITFFSHAITFLIFWEKIYFAPSMIWNLPLEVNFRKSISEPAVLYAGIIFVIIFGLLFIFKHKSNTYQNIYRK